MFAGGGRVLACGDFLIRRACRRLPESVRERELEWLGELPVILSDPGLRFGWIRVLRMLWFVGGAAKCAHHMFKAADASQVEAAAASRSRAGAIANARESNGPARFLAILVIALVAVVALVIAAMFAFLLWMSHGNAIDALENLGIGIFLAIASPLARYSRGANKRRERVR